MLNLTIHIVNNEGKLTGWISGIKGVIAQGNSVQEIKDELIEGLGIKLKVQSDIEKKEVSGSVETMDLNLCIA